MKRFIYAAVFLLSTIAWCAVSADEIVLENGDRLSGTVKTMGEDTITLETDYSDPIRIQKSKIQRIYVNRPVDIHLSGGEILKGKIRSEGDGKIIVEPSAERDASIVRWENVTAINPPEVKPSKWAWNVTIGAGLQTGNTDRANASVGAEATRRTEQDRYSLRFLFNYAEEDEAVSARNTYGAGKYDYFFTKKIYGYLGVELLNDEFKDLNLRTVVGPGVGYQVWEDGVKYLLVETGVSYFSEDRKVAEDDDWITARLASNIRYNIGKFLVFTDQLIIYPGLEDFGEYQLRNEAAISSPLASGWSLKLASILERDSDPPENVEKNDWQWLLGLQFDFK